MPPGSHAENASLRTQWEKAKAALQKATEQIQQLDALNRILEQRVTQSAAEADQRASELRALVVELCQAEQRERLRLARLLHDHIQQLLVAARMQAGTLERRLSDENHRKLLHHLDDLIHQAIQASRTLTVELSPPILQEGGLVRALEWLARWMQEKHGLEVKLDLPENVSTGEEIRYMVFEATRELLFNVVKHAHVYQAHLSMRWVESGWIEIVVRDEGCGFDPHQRLLHHQSVSAGFGLFNVRERVEWLGGSLEIHSSPGKGTEARLLAPSHATPGRGKEEISPDSESVILSASPRASRPAVPVSSLASSSTLPTIRVFLVDDHQIMREGLAGLLEFESDIQVIGEAEDGQAAVEAARRLHPDVIIMDVSMPRLNGVEATRRIKKEMPDTRIIGLSMHTESDMAEQMYEAGASVFLTKGGPAEALVSAIRGKNPQAQLQYSETP